MIDKIKNNTKIKLISLLSSIVLWLYVMAVVDPQETKVIENLPITINNISELNEKNLMLYPESELTTSIYITGKLSNLKKIRPQNIHVYGQINDPIEGNNELYLKASISGDVNYEFKTNIINIQLDKVIEEKRTIDIKVEGESKDKIIESLNPSMDAIKVSGPRTLVNQVQKIVATLDLKNHVDDFSTKLKLTPVDEEGKEVIGVDLEEQYITVETTLLKQKTVPIQIRLEDKKEEVEGIKDYKLSQSTITIKGKKDIIDKIDVIYTEPINLQSLIGSTSKEILLEIPDNILADNKYVNIIIDVIENITKDFIYQKEELEIRNNINNIDISKLEIPDSIDVKVEYNDSIENLDKSDISLYIDLGEDTLDGVYEIKYESEYEFKNITINPITIELK